jgi:hypothetical protein
MPLAKSTAKCEPVLAAAQRRLELPVTADRKIDAIGRTARPERPARQSARTMTRVEATRGRGNRSSSSTPGIAATAPRKKARRFAFKVRRGQYL